MHRYRPDTVSVVLNKYLREYQGKLQGYQTHLTQIRDTGSKGEKAEAIQEIETVTKTLAELEAYERDILYPLATQNIEIDLDDGVDVNYPKFGEALEER